MNEPEQNSNFRRLIGHWPLLLIVMVWFIVFFDMNTGQSVVGYRDSAYLYYPYFQWIDMQWASGHIPLWNPYCDLGYPVVGDGSSSVFYPGKLIFLCRFLDYPVRYGLYLSLHVLFAACAGYFLTLRMGANAAGAGVSGFSYAFGGSVLFQLTNVIYLVSAAWLPVGILCLFQLRRSREWSSVIGLSLVASMMILGGDPQMAYMLGVIALISGVGQLIWCRKRYRSWKIWYTKLFLGFYKLTLFVVVASGLSAIQLLPTYFWSQQSKRVVDQSISVREKSLEPMAGSHLDAVYQFSQPPWSMAELVWPNFSGKLFPVYSRWMSGFPGADRIWTPSLYVGGVAVFFAINGCCVFYGSRRRKWLTWLALLFAFSSFGWYGGVWLIRELGSCLGFSNLFLDAGVGNSVGGLYWLMTIALPGFDSFRYPAKLFVVSSLAICVLGGLGLGQQRIKRHAVAFASVVMSISIVGWCWGSDLIVICLNRWQISASSSQFFGPFDVDVWRDAFGNSMLHVFCGFLVFFCFYFVARVLLGRGGDTGEGELDALPARKLLGILVFVLAMADVWVANGWMLCPVPSDAFAGPVDVHSRIKSANADGPFLRLNHHCITPGAWESTCSDNRLSEIVQWQRNSLHPKHHLLIADEFGLELSRSFSSIEHRSLSRWHTVVWANCSFNESRNLVNGSISTERDSGETGLKLKSPTNKKVKLLTVGQELSLARADDEFKEIGNASWKLVSRNCNVLYFKIESGEPGIFVCNMLPDSGWRVKVLDDSKAAVHQERHEAGQFHLAVKFPSGKHEIRFEYVPLEFWVGMWVSIVSWIALMGLVIRAWKLRS